jgi:hypothetical protein
MTMPIATSIEVDVQRPVGMNVRVIIRAVDVVVGARNSAGAAGRRFIVVCQLGQ